MQARKPLVRLCVTGGVSGEAADSIRQLLPAAEFRLQILGSLAEAVAAAEQQHADLLLFSCGTATHEAIEAARRELPTVTLVGVAASHRTASEEVACAELVDAWLHLPIVSIDQARGLIRLTIERRDLLLENSLIRSEIERLSTSSQHLVDDKTREVLFAKERLTCLFQCVPAVMAAVTIEHKLAQAAAALCGPNFFRSARLYLDDVQKGMVTGEGGVPLVTLASIERYRDLRVLLGDQPSTTIAADTASGSGGQPVLIAPVRDHEGHLVGLAELGDGDEVSIPHPETLALIELFLTLTSQSIEQFRLERELEESEASYRSLIDNVGDVIFRTERDGKINFVSRQVIGMLGQHWRQVLGTNFFDHVRESDRSDVQVVLPYLLEGHSHVRDIGFLRQDGREMVAFVSLTPVTEHGAITGIMAVARDVTEKRRLERQIEDSEHRYRALLENANDAIVLIDPVSHRIVDANPQMLQLVGYSREELMRMTAFDIRPPSRQAEVQARIESVMSSGQGRFEDVPILRNDGEYVYVDTSASALELEGQRFYQAILRDVTAQRAMNDALNKRVIELQVLTEVSDALQSSVDLRSVMGIVLAGVTAGSGLGFNRAYILSFDESHAMLHGEAGVGPASAEDAWRIWSELNQKAMTLSEMFAQRVSGAAYDFEAQSQYARALRVDVSDEANPFSCAMRERDAVLVTRASDLADLPGEFLTQYQASEFAIVPLCTRDEVLGVLLVDNLFSLRPIEEEDLHRLKLFANSAASAFERGRLLVSLEKRLHELTLANQHLKESRDRLIKTERLSAIGEVAASVAHEIRNPLAAIGGFARSVYSSLGERDRNKQKVGIIIEETARLDEILRSILEFSRPSVPKFAEIDLNGLVLQTVHFMDAEIDDQLIQIHYELDPALPPAWADASQIRQVLLNIMRNSVQEMPGGGELRIRSEFVGTMLKLAVSDSGPGIPPERLEKIFDAFFTTKPSGSGLGLSICSQIVRNHNGRLEAFSNPGEGATFIMTLPAAGTGS
ncbi:PAS domain S-box protein [candidate division KSB1 bacterium]|nr:PAS domain S-box protein [candidate division KSB1 bacterium]